MSFVPRYGRELVDASPDGTLWIRRKGVTKLLSVSIDGTALTSDELADVALYPGRLYRVPSLGWRATKARGVVVEYEHGHKSPPYAIHQAALIYARSILVTSDLSDRTIVFTNELGTVRNAVAGRDYPTGIPAVDAALYRYGERTLLR